MLHSVLRSAVVVLSTFVFSLALAAQTPAGTPKRDLNGFWAPVRVGDGIGANGGLSSRADGKHEPPYSAEGKAAFLKNRPSNGTTEVGPGDENDPGHACDPLGMPRSDLFELRGVQFVSVPKQSQMLVLYQYDRVWRSIWTDGRALPKDPDPRWYGYSAGKWTDDYTFEVDTVGLDDRTWIDNSGRPHSEDLKVHEIFHRTGPESLEITIEINDPKYYTKPWIATDKIQMKLMPVNYEPLEMMCSPLEYQEYNLKHADLGKK